MPVKTGDTSELDAYHQKYLYLFYVIREIVVYLFLQRTKETFMAFPTLNKIRFSSYKRFSGKECLAIRPVTLLVGKNSSGKSSITKLLAILAKSFSGTLKKSAMTLETDGVSLGVSYQSLCHNGNSTGLTLGVAYDNEISFDVELIASPKDEIQILRYVVSKGDKEHIIRLAEDKINYVCDETGKIYLNSDFSGFVHKQFLADLGIQAELGFDVDYIGPLRCEPVRNYYYIGGDLLDNVGPKGDNAYQLLCADEVLARKVSQWFEVNFDGCRLRVEPGSEKGAYLIQMHKSDNEDYWVNIADEGMGMSQVLPIVTRCLYKVPYSIVVVEQPELHLHPAAHAELARLFAQSCKSNRQSYVIETHSENILLGLRDAVVDPDIDIMADDVIVYFIDEDEDGVYLKEIFIEEDGTLTDWPQGVFNESYELLKGIMEKAYKK